MTMAMPEEVAMKRTLAASSLLVVALLMGCDQPPFAQPAPPPPVAVTPQPAPPVMPMTDSVKADVGSGQRGRSLDQYEGAVVTPVKAIFSTEEYLAYNVSVVQALNLFEAENGRRPKDHTEFMEKIIKPNNIKLPVLPEGQSYRWDPTQGEKGELMVDRPKGATTPGFVPAPTQP